jgi:hypothetical protein
MSTEMSYGDYDFDPVPFMRLGRVPQKTGAGEIIGFTWQVTLSGDLLAVPSGSIVTIDQKQDLLGVALSEDGKLFSVSCDGDILLNAYPKINAVTFEQGVWVNRSPYTVEMEFDTVPTGQVDYISDYSEDWSFEFVDERSGYTQTLEGGVQDTLPFQARITHNLSATGKTVYLAGGLTKPAYKQAKSFITGRLGLDNEFVENSGIINLSAANYSNYNHFRTLNANEAGGTYAVSETWLLANTEASGVAGNAIEDFTVSVRTAVESPIRSVSIEGTIQGLETRTYGNVPGDFFVTEHKYDAAADYWAVVKTKLRPRCDLVLDGISALRNLNINPISTSEGHNIAAGTISYSYEYNDRPSNCFTDALYESITVTDNNPADVFASIFVLGRANGPVLQNLSTVTSATRSLQIEVVYEPPTGCPTTPEGVTTLLGYHIKSPGDFEVEDLVDLFEDQLELAYTPGQVFRNEDTKTWIPKEGRYTRQVTWTYSTC